MAKKTQDQNHDELQQAQSGDAGEFDPINAAADPARVEAVLAESPAPPTAEEARARARDDMDAQQGSPAKQRPLSAPRSNVIYYVNRMRNVGKVSGFVVGADREHFLLQQNNNIEHALRVQVNPRYVSPKRLLGRPISVKLHVRGYRDAHGPQVSIHCIEIDRPTILDMPLQRVWAAGFGGFGAATTLAKLAEDGFTPFDAEGNIRAEYLPYLRSSDEEGKGFDMDPAVRSFVDAMRVMGDVLDVSGGAVSSRSRAGQNYFSVAGCVDMCSMIPGNEHRGSYGLIMLRQQAGQDANIPVRVTGSQAGRYLDRLRRGLPILVEGNIRRKIIPDEEGKIVSTHTYIETKRISPATFGVDIMNPLPAWWNDIPQQERLERERRRQEAEDRKALAMKRREEEGARAANMEPDAPSAEGLDF